MKIGLLAYSTKTGLGYQTRDFYEFIKPDKVLIPDLSMLNGMPTDHSWAKEPRVCKNIPSNQDMEWLVDGMDIVFVCETPLNHYLFEYAKKKGVKTVLQYNYEFLAYFKRAELAKPDILAAPSMWGIDIVRSKNWGIVTHWPVPIDTKGFEFRRMNEVQTFVHIIGRPAHSDRNGTILFLEAAKHLKQFNYIVYLQRPKEGRVHEHFKQVSDALEGARNAGVKLEIIEDVSDNKEMYSRGEVLILPRRYGGLCLPMWEALASGMPVIMPDISPNNTILPKEWLVKSEQNGSFQAHTEIELYDTKVDYLATKMLEVSKDIGRNNLIAGGIANRMSWRVQKTEYLKRFEEICESSSIRKLLD